MPDPLRLSAPAVPGLPLPSMDPGVRGFTVRAPAPANIPLLDVRGFVAAEQAAATALAQGLETTGTLLGRMAEEQFASINRRKVDEASDKLDAAGDDIARLIRDQPDETKWASILDTEARRAETTVLQDETLSPFARRAITEKYTVWRTRAERGLRRASYDRSIRLETEGLEGRRMQALAGSDWQGAEALTKEQLRRQLVSADTAAAQRAQSAQRQEEARVEAQKNGLASALADFWKMLPDNPWGAMAGIASAFIDDTTRRAAEAEGLRAIVLYQADRLAEAREKSVAFAGEPEIHSIAARGRLTEGETGLLLENRRALMAARAAPPGPFDWERAEQLHDDIQAYDPEDYDTLAEAVATHESLFWRAEVAGVSAGGEPGAHVRDVWGVALGEKHPFPSRRPEGTEEQARAAFENALDRFHSDGIFGERWHHVTGPRETQSGRKVTATRRIGRHPALLERMRAAKRLREPFMAAVQSLDVNPADPESVNRWLIPRIYSPRPADKIRRTLYPADSPADRLQRILAEPEPEPAPAPDPAPDPAPAYMPNKAYAPYGSETPDAPAPPPAVP